MPESTDLDARRGMAAQRATEQRREGHAVARDQTQLKERREVMEKHLFSEPAVGWPEAVEKARYLLTLLSKDVSGSRIRHMVDGLLFDFDRLLPPRVASEGES